MLRILEWALRGYKAAISPYVFGSCRYVPTCSEYAAEALAKHGWRRGSRLAAARVVRCHPFGGRGFDPPPFE